jgi:energy-coupling factor transporter ATP-binding protein EcfA2
MSAGPTRLVLINSGGFSYAELDLTESLHLVGRNNIGKSTLVNILQVLYIDDRSQMLFPESLRETYNHYFPGDRSYVLFECSTPGQGRRVVGAHGTGPGGKGFERFAYEGAFDKDLFVSQSGDGNWMVRPAADVQKELSLQGYRSLEARTLRGALTGVEESKGLSLGLVPVEEEGAYKRFRGLFKGLIRLRQLGQRELKNRLCTIYASEEGRTSIELRESFEDGFRVIDKKRNRLRDLKALEGRVEQAARKRQQRDRARRKAIGHWLRAHRTATLETVAARHERAAVREREAELRQQLELIDDRLEEAETRKGKLQKLLGRDQEQKEKVERVIERAKGKDVDALRGEIEELEQEKQRLDEEIGAARRESASEVQRQIRSTEEKIEALRESIENFEGLVGTVLGKHLDDESIEPAFRLLHPDLLEVGIEQVRNLEGRQLAREVETLSEQVGRGTLDVAGGISLEVGRLPEPPSVGRFRDPDRLRAEVRDLEKRRDELQSRLEAIQNVEAKRERSENIRRRIRSLEEEVSLCEEAHQKRNVLSDLTEEIEEKQRRLDTLEEKLASIRETKEEIRQRHRSCQREARRLQQTIRQIEDIRGQMPPPPGGWCEIVGSAEDAGRYAGSIRRGDGFTDVREDVDDLAGAYEAARGRAKDRHARLQDQLERIHSSSRGEYRRESPEETLHVLQERVGSIGEIEDEIEVHIRQLLTDADAKFEALLRSLEEIKSVAGTINRRLGQTGVSDLEKIGIEITERSRVSRMLRSAYEEAATPLFHEEGEEGLEELKNVMGEHPEIDLSDLFDVQFKVEKADGSVERYDGLDSIQSNGTSITIKVLVYLVLINDLLGDTDVRVPFYLDEASSLDKPNLDGIVQAARKMGFVPILASPTPSDSARQIYQLRKNGGGRVHLDDRDRLRLADVGEGR